jgi:hypothetical protein
MSKFFYGAYALEENGIAHTHSKYARLIINDLTIAPLETTSLQLKETIMQVKNTFKVSDNKPSQIYIFQLQPKLNTSDNFPKEP